MKWRVINAADYGMPQKCRRIYIYGEFTGMEWGLGSRVLKEGAMA